MFHRKDIQKPGVTQVCMQQSSLSEPSHVSDSTVQTPQITSDDDDVEDEHELTETDCELPDVEDKVLIYCFLLNQDIGNR